MTESAGEIKSISQYKETVLLEIKLEPEHCTDPSQIFEWKILEKVKVVGNEQNTQC